MHYVIYGAGAIGSVIGAHLHRAGRDVTLIARGKHLEALQRDGLRLDTADGALTLAIPAVGSPAEITWTDETAVLLCVKSQQTAGALETLAEVAPADTIVVSCQNGVANEREILRRFARTYAVPVVLPATHLEPGVVVQDSAPSPGVLDCGRYPAGSDDVTETLVTDFRAAGFGGTVRDDVMAWKYRKLLINLGNGVEAATAAGPAQDELVARAWAEALAVYDAAGIVAVSDEEDAANRAAHITLRTDIVRPGGSTVQSMTRGSSVEVDFLSGEIVLLGRLHGVATPANELVQHTVHRLVHESLPPQSIDAADLLARLHEHGKKDEIGL